MLQRCSAIVLQEKGDGMRTISILNFKGGVGKSTLATNLSYALSDTGRVLVIDCDMQGNATTTLLDEIDGPTLTHVLTGRTQLADAIHKTRHNLSIVPSDSEIHTAAAYIVSQGPRAYVALKRALKTLDEQYDYVIFDHSPSYSAVSHAALLASEEMLIPCELTSWSVDGIVTLTTTLENTLVDHELRLAGIVPMKLNRSIRMHTAYLDDLRAKFGAHILTPVRQDTAVPYAQSQRQTVFEYDAGSKAAADFAVIANEVRAREAVTA